jgi:hypothetical protein
VAAVATRQAITAKTAAAKSDRSDRANPHTEFPVATRSLFLIEWKAIAAEALTEGSGYRISIRLEWPTQITETEFFRQVKAMPKAKVHGFLSTG